MQSKLKERLDVFSDAIIAILITIMVLELPITLHSGVVDYTRLFQSIGIYAVSFCFIANLWYQHAVIFNEADTVPNAIIILDLVWLFTLSLIPTFTRMMTSETTNINVMLYAGLCLIISAIFRRITKTVLHAKYTEKSDMRQLYNVIYGSGYLDSGVMYIVLIILGYFWPKVVLVLLIIIPIRSFISHAHEHEELNELEKMDTTEKRDFLALPLSEQRRFRQLLQHYFTQARRQHGDQAGQQQAWTEFANTAKTEFHVSDQTLGKWMKHSQPRDRQQHH
ncbi:TMEM175 family protein [Lactiplantibacillus mudanjiangensis]|uniref:Uncharacterized protein n=1 Tax=Lactiplantibacillus mudanjiangensis TaxID=1296538 RepID=A0A660E0V7_9LACO|nr:TMEM175 family protein [Lactiplantibacillus mudanjiangensis]VDG25085.1 hypothetical protein MUDAN_IGPPGNFN_03065 [Lactiplantibacillus mudanjiangensis]VDG29010.1 hypothetical protein MUDAN_MDHGFNIF_03403 [Lactiplantibacillus mudanjiangensis]